MQIHPVNHGTTARDKNRYCGPSAISAVTQMKTGDAARLLREISGKPAIKGVSDYYLCRALRLCGITVTAIRVKPISPIIIKGRPCTQPTLAGWLRDSVSIRTPGRVFLVVAGHHFQVISGRRFVCAQTDGIISIRDKKAGRRRRVEAVYELTAPNGIKAPSLATRGRPKVDPAYTAFRKLVKEHGWKYRVYPECGINYIEIQPTKLWPKGLDTLHYCWGETLGRIQHCLEHPEDVVEGCYSE